jgi:hypothetical protein
MRPHLKLFSALLINVRTSQDGVTLDARRNRNRPTNTGVSPLGVIHDLFSRSIKRSMIVRFHPNSNPIALHYCPVFTSSKPSDGISARWVKSEGKTVSAIFFLSMFGKNYLQSHAMPVRSGASYAPNQANSSKICFLTFVGTSEYFKGSITLLARPVLIERNSVV